MTRKIFILILVFLFFHHRFPNTVKNCHERPARDGKSASALNSVLDKYGGSYIVGAFSGDIHGSMYDPNTVLETTHNGVKFVNAGVFSSGLVTDDAGNCEEEDSGIYESQFMVIKQGAKTVELFRHQTFYDQTQDGKNDVNPRWMDDHKSSIELAYPGRAGSK